MFAEAFDPDAGRSRPIDEIEELEPTSPLPPVTEPELSTILAALRQHQRDGWLDPKVRGCYFPPGAEPLAGVEIDDLCRRLNAGA